MANKIQIDIEANDQASAELAKVAAQAATLGGVLGGALSGIVRDLTRTMMEFANAPFEAANAMAELARKGYEVKDVFGELAEAQNKSSNAWKELANDLAERVAPAMIKVAEQAERIAKALNQDVGTERPGKGGGGTWGPNLTLGQYLRNLGNSQLGEAPWDSYMPGSSTGGPTGGGLMGPFATPEQLAESRRLLRIINEQQREIARLAREAAARQRKNNMAKEIGPENYDPSMYNQLPDWSKPGYDIRQESPAGVSWYSNKWGDEAVKAGQQVASGLAQVAAQFVTGMTTLGEALKSFFQNTVGSILAELAKLGISAFLNFISGGATGGILGILGKVGKGLTGGLRAGSARGGNIIFQGLNTRDMYAAVIRGGPLARADDLRSMRAEAY